MTPQEFTRLLDTYGADAERWPEEARAAARRLCEASPAARRQWAAARRLDAQLAAGRSMPRDPARESRIVAGAMARIRALAEPVLDWRWFFTRSMGAALAASVVVGWLVGMGLPGEVPPHHLAGGFRFEDLIQ